MRVIGVVDLLAGRAVHARAGRRDSYEPVRAVAGSLIEPGDALALAGAYVERLGIEELYAADLDAILDGLRDEPDTSALLADAPHDERPGTKAGRASHHTLVAELTGFGFPLWLDAAVTSTDRADRALRLGVTRVVVGLETLRSYDALEEICAAVGGDRVAFSLDLRDGEPVIAPTASGTGPRIAPGEPAHIVAARAAGAGAGAVIVIDLARVGTSTGLDFGLIERVRAAVPGLLLAGGGVRGLEDCARLADAGCDGALVGTALHDGRLRAADVAATQGLARRSGGLHT